MINKDELIDMLIENPQSAKDEGFNHAIIKILKNTSNPLTVDGILRQNLTGYGKYTGEQLFELRQSLIDSKLRAVKLHKDVSGLGLKEAKDDIDAILTKIEALPTTI